MRKIVRIAGHVVFLALVAACGRESNGGTTLEDFMKSNAMAPFTMRQVFGEKVAKVVIVCPFDRATDAKKALGFDFTPDAGLKDGEQVVLAASSGAVIERDRMSREVVDFCGTTARSPHILQPSARITLTLDKWSDGSEYKVAHVD